MAINDDELASEIHTVTTDGILRRTRSLFDPESEKIISEISNGLCSGCGKTLNEGNVVRCCFGDLACSDCVVRHHGHSVCRNDVELNVGTKSEALALLCIFLKLTRDTTKRIARLSETSLRQAVQSLEQRGYIARKSCGLVGNGVKINEFGLDVIGILVEAYRHDHDFKAFLARIGWEKNVGSE